STEFADARGQLRVGELLREADVLERRADLLLRRFRQDSLRRPRVRVVADRQADDRGRVPERLTPVREVVRASRIAREPATDFPADLVEPGVERVLDGFGEPAV